MKFYEVLEALENGKNIRRQSWENLHISMYEGVIVEGILLNELYVNDFKMHDFSQDDILADDWVILD